LEAITFEPLFKSILSALSANNSDTEKLWQEISACYGTKERYYHNLSHLDNLAAELTPLKDKIVDWPTIVFSIAYHDIVYNPMKRDNEERSADLAFDRLIALGVPLAQREKCKQQILYTKGHQLSTDADTNYFTDADLAILGSEQSVYLQYAEQIRKEYKYYPDILYKPGRKKVLEHFLQMNTIFKTKFFREKYEDCARENMRIELRSL
jgi:predicted metal-dependent HD superfamily phosphohydrolase